LFSAYAHPLPARAAHFKKPSVLASFRRASKGELSTPLLSDEHSEHSCTSQPQSEHVPLEERVDQYIETTADEELVAPNVAEEKTHPNSEPEPQPEAAPEYEEKSSVPTTGILVEISNEYPQRQLLFVVDPKLLLRSTEPDVVVQLKVPPRVLQLRQELRNYSRR
jgi:hypothetical protein